MKRLEGKVAIVTGGAGAIGRTVCEAMAAEGASVVVADISIKGAEEIAAAIEELGGAAIGCGADVSDRAEVEALVAAAESSFGVPSVVFHSAGITNAGGPTGLLELSDADWGRIVDVNLRGTFLVSQVVARRLVAVGQGGSIITVSSIGAQRPMFGSPAYHATKAGVSGLTRALAVNLAHYGIRANGIAPGYIATQMMRDVMTEDQESVLLSRVPMVRFGTPADLIGVAVFLASDESSYITGQILGVDGGALVLGWTPAQSPTSVVANSSGAV
jgi:NAD(P)-dependent dehydrogenase (short-subunit alcohol dehydrogenase family)